MGVGITALFQAIAAAANAYASWVKMQREHEIDDLEDQIDKLAAIGDPASKLRMERLNIRKQRKIESLSVIQS